MTRSFRALIVRLARYLRVMSSRFPTASIRWPRIATAPSEIIRLSASIVTTEPPSTTKSTLIPASVIAATASLQSALHLHDLIHRQHILVQVGHNPQSPSDYQKYDQQTEG